MGSIDEKTLLLFGLNSVEQLSFRYLTARDGGISDPSALGLFLLALFIAKQDRRLCLREPEILPLLQNAWQSIKQAPIPPEELAPLREWLEARTYRDSPLFSLYQEIGDLPAAPNGNLIQVFQAESPVFTLKRYAVHQWLLADAIRRRLPPSNAAGFRFSRTAKALETLKPLLPQKPELLLDCLRKMDQSNLILIYGGPGSGKTTLLASLLCILGAAQRESAEPLNIALSAPTGRAVKRLREGMIQAASLLGSEALKSVPDTARTLHKLLGLGEISFRPKPLLYDLIVVDETSMLDAELALQLFQSSSRKTKLLFVGDPEQLPPVATGLFWQEILTGAESETHQLYRICIKLETSHRSGQEIQMLARCILEADVDRVKQLLLGESDGDLPFPKRLRMHPPPPIGEAAREIWERFQLGPLLAEYPAFPKPVQQWKDYIPVLSRFFETIRDFAVLSPFRVVSEYSAQNLNRRVAFLCRDSGHRGTPLYSQWYSHGMPIQILSNDYQLQLFNGDNGFIFCFQNQYFAFFQKPFGDGPAEEGGHLYSYYPLHQIKSFQSSYVQTIHKSQGSEFKNVLIILGEKHTEFISQKHFYTAVTRAKERLELWGDPALLAYLIGRETQPYSLLSNYLQNILTI